MKTIVFIKRNLKEILRDPISLIFCLGLPLFLLVIFQQFNIPSDVYSIENFTPSIIVFSFGFISLFSGLLVSKDRTSSFLTRLFSSPLTAFNYIMGYSVSLLPLAIVQSTLFLLVAMLFGLKFSINVFFTILISIPISILFIGMGILIGCSFNDKQTPGFASIIIQLVSFTSGIWFDVNMLSVGFQNFCNILPFKYALDLMKAALSGNFDNMTNAILILSLYTIVIFTIAVIVFKHKMTGDNK